MSMRAETTRRWIAREVRRLIVVGTALVTACVAACSRSSHVTHALPAVETGFATSQPAFRFKVLDVPNARRTVASGINDRGEVVGAYDDSSGTHGFLFRDDKFTTIDYPGASFTVTLGVGVHGDIVGTYRMPGEPPVNFHGFLRRSDGVFERVDSPPYKNTIAQRILPDGTILGCRHDDDFGASMKGAVLRGRVSETSALASMHNGATPD